MASTSTSNTSKTTAIIPDKNDIMFDDEEEVEQSMSMSKSSSASAGNNNKMSAETRRQKSHSRKVSLFTFLIISIGCLGSASFLYVGITAELDDKQSQFDRRANEVVQELQSAWGDYVVGALWVHQACHGRVVTRQEFRELYEALNSGGLEFQAAEFIPNVTKDERATMEAEDKEFYAQNYPDQVTFHGLKGFEPDPEGGVSVQNRSQQDFYFPVRFVEPVVPNAAAAGFDLYSSESRRATIHQALETWKPALTHRLQLVQETDPSAYSVLLMHPGVPLTTQPDLKPRDLSLLVIRIPALLERAYRKASQSLGMYMYDTTLSPPQFLGAISVVHDAVDGNNTVEFLPELELQDLIQQSHSTKIKRERIVAASHTWEIVVFPVTEQYESNLVVVWITGVLIAVAAAVLALALYYHSMRRAHAVNQIIVRAEADEAIITGLFPSNVRDRLVQEADCAARSKDSFDLQTVEDTGSTFMENSNIFGSQPIADLFSDSTVFFGDLVNFTAWSKVREPAEVFTLLETVYYEFDRIAKRRFVFKVETVGDCYVACTGVPKPKKEHAINMAKFAADVLIRMPQVTQRLAETLGPGTSTLSVRIGIHSGPVTAGVLRGDKGRFQLFGDTMNTASRIESTGEAGRAQCSESFADLLRQSGRGAWLEPRKDRVQAKGLGEVKTWWLKPSEVAGVSSDKKSVHETAEV